MAASLPRRRKKGRREGVAVLICTDVNTCILVGIIYCKQWPPLYVLWWCLMSWHRINYSSVQTETVGVCDFLSLPLFSLSSPSVAIYHYYSVGYLWQYSYLFPSWAGSAMCLVAVQTISGTLSMNGRYSAISLTNKSLESAISQSFHWILLFFIVHFQVILP